MPKSSLHLERRLVSVDPGKELEGLVPMRKHVFPHPLQIQPNSLAPVRMSAEKQITTRREF